MANLLELFQKQVIGSNGKIADYIARISAIGDFSRVTNLQTILSSWNNILLTPLRSYTFEPNFGSELFKYVFEPADMDTLESIKNEVEYRLSAYDDRATVNNIDVKFLSDRKGFVLNIVADYEGESGELSLLLDEALYLNFMET